MLIVTIKLSNVQAILQFSQLFHGCLYSCVLSWPGSSLIVMHCKGMVRSLWSETVFLPSCPCDIYFSWFLTWSHILNLFAYFLRLGRSSLVSLNLNFIPLSSCNLEVRSTRGVDEMRYRSTFLARILWWMLVLRNLWKFASFYYDETFWAHFLISCPTPGIVVFPTEPKRQW